MAGQNSAPQFQGKRGWFDAETSQTQDIGSARKRFALLSWNHLSSDGGLAAWPSAPIVRLPDGEISDDLFGDWLGIEPEPKLDVGGPRERETCKKQARLTNRPFSEILDGGRQEPAKEHPELPYGGGIVDTANGRQGRVGARMAPRPRALRIGRLTDEFSGRGWLAWLRGHAGRRPPTDRRGDRRRSGSGRARGRWS